MVVGAADTGGAVVTVGAAAEVKTTTFTFDAPYNVESFPSDNFNVVNNDLDDKYSVFNPEL